MTPVNENYLTGSFPQQPSFDGFARPATPQAPPPADPVQNYEVHLLDKDGREFTVVVQATQVISDPHFVRFVNSNVGSKGSRAFNALGTCVALIPAPRFRYCRTL